MVSGIRHPRPASCILYPASRYLLSSIYDEFPNIRVMVSGIRHLASTLSTRPGFPVKTAVLNGFCQVFRFYFFIACKICNGPAYLKDAVIGPGGKVEFFHCNFQKVLSNGVNYADLFQLFAAHLSIAVNAGLIVEPFCLDLSRLDHPLTDMLRRFSIFM